MHIVFSGGGTGGHLFPGLAVAQQLRAQRPDIRITFCGHGQPFDRTQVHAANFSYRGFPCAPLSPSVRGLWRFYRRQRRGARMASEFLQTEQVSLVVGLGGYASVPAAHAAGRLNIPLALLEQNVIPGRANRWLAHKAELVCISFEESRALWRSRARLVRTGNPLRFGFVKPGSRAVSHDRRRLVVLGGSRGARDLNEEVPRALYKVRKDLGDWTIIHVCGSSTETTRRLYQNLGLHAEVREFVGDMPDVLGGASLAVSRAGGTTLAELAALGIPAILIPYPRATNNHQRANANIYVQAGAAAIIDSRGLSGRLHAYLDDTLSQLVGDAVLRNHMSHAMRSLSSPTATADVTDHICRLLPPRAQTHAA